MPTIIVQYYMLCILINHKFMRNQHREIQVQVDNIQGNAGASWKQTGKFRRRPETDKKIQPQVSNRWGNSGAGRQQTGKFRRRPAADREIQAQADNRLENSGAGRKRTGKCRRKLKTDREIQVQAGSRWENPGTAAGKRQSYDDVKLQEIRYQVHHSPEDTSPNRLPSNQMKKFEKINSMDAPVDHQGPI